MVSLGVTTGPIDALQTINDLTYWNGVPLLATGFLVMLWLIVFSRVKNRAAGGRAIAASTFFTMLMAYPLSFLGLLPDSSFFVITILAGLSLVPLVAGKNA